LTNTKLSHRKIADILCVNNNAVHKVSLGKKEEKAGRTVP